MKQVEYTIDKSDRGTFPMGAVMLEESVHFCVGAKGENCRLLLFRRGENAPSVRLDFPEVFRVGDVWSMMVHGKNWDKLEYSYEIDGIEIRDPYGRNFTGRELWGDLEHINNPMRSRFIDFSFDWEGDRPLFIPFEDSVIYRIHTRGFTQHNTSRIKEKGTFKGIMNKIPYLKDLGITTLEMMPPVEFEEVMVTKEVMGNPFGNAGATGRINYWGYEPACYFAPKASFSSGHEKNPEIEFKTLVKELHKNGIEIVIELFFAKDTSPTILLDSLRFWVKEFHIDGIHLVGDIAIHLVASDPYLSRTKLFAAKWDGVPSGNIRHLGEYNDGFLIDMRRLLKGDEDQINNLIYRSKRNPKNCGVINYIANTNGFTLMDMVSYDMKHNEVNGEDNRDGNSYNYSWNCGIEGKTKKKKIIEIRKKQLKNALLIVFLSQGTPLLLSGDEMGNSKNGNNNSYCQDNETSWINWNLLKSNGDIFEFVKFIIAFRKSHPIFHMKDELMVMDYLACGHPDVSYHGVKVWCPEFDNYRRQLGIMYCGGYSKREDGTPDDYFYVAFNMHWEDHEFALPNLPKHKYWHIAIDTNEKESNGFYKSGTEPILKIQKQCLIPSRTIVVFIGKERNDNSK